MIQKDSRIKLVNEVLNGMKVLYMNIHVHVCILYTLMHVHVCAFLLNNCMC